MSEEHEANAKDGAPAERRPARRGKRILLVAAAIVPAVAIWRGLFEVTRLAAAEPSPHVDSRAALAQLAGSAPGVDPARAAHAWRILREILDRTEEIERTLGGGRIDYARILRAPRRTDGVEFERRIIEALRERGIFDLLAEFTESAPAAPVLEGGGPLLEDPLPPEVPRARALAATLAAAMRFAQWRGDHAQVARLFDALLALRRSVALQPLSLSSATASAIDDLAHAELRRQLGESSFDQATCRALLASIDALPPVPASHVIEGERIVVHDTIQWTFSDDGAGDGYFLGTTIAPQAGARPRAGLLRLADSRFFTATRRETLEAADALFDEAIESAREGCASARAGPALPGPEHALAGRYWMLPAIVPRLERVAEEECLARFRAEATRVMLGIAIHQAEHGAPPPALASLSGILSSAPVDPLHGGSFGYRPLDGAADGRAYLLYGYGRDGRDDGGVFDPSDPGRALDPDAAGVDYEINAVRATDG